MCGVVGFLPTNQTAQETLNKMLNRIVHRGPDDEGIFIDQFVALGHRRLSIIDIESGKQPMIYNDFVVIFNGEIYNFIELKERLKKLGHHFCYHSDTEVLLHAYEEYGYHMLQYLRGMFAFVIYDQNKEELFIARDHFGMKPLYYYYDQQHLLFGSEIKSFLDHPFFVKEFNSDVLDMYLKLGFVPGEETFFKNVKQLLPGHYMVYKNSQLNICQYYQFDFDNHTSQENMIFKLEQTLKDSIEHHTISDVEVGSFLSGGIDSSYIVSVAKPQRTYTLGYDDQKYSEIEYAKELSEHLNVNNYSRVLSKKEYFNELYKVLYHMDEPLSDPSAISLYFLSEKASKDVKVVLSGEGADEIFGGYNTYRSQVDMGLYGKFPHQIRRFIANIVKYCPDFKGKSFLIRNGKSVHENYLGVNPVFTDYECHHLMQYPNIRRHEDLLAVLPDIKNAYTDIQKKQAIDLRMWFVKDILLKGDKMTMAHSLESRMPFTDINVFEMASFLHDEHKVTKQNTKILLRQIAFKMIPQDISSRKKRGFPVPLREWMRDDDIYVEIKKQLQTPFMLSLFNQQMMINLLDEHKLRKKDSYKKIWTLYCLSLWHQVFFEEEYK